MAEGLSMPRHHHKAHLPRDPGGVEPVAHNRGLNNTPSYHLSSLLLIQRIIILLSIY